MAEFEKMLCSTVEQQSRLQRMSNKQRYRDIAGSEKHGMTESSAEHSADLFSKTSGMVPNRLNIPMYES